jgi:hypothetical protein
VEPAALNEVDGLAGQHKEPDCGAGIDQEQLEGAGDDWLTRAVPAARISGAYGMASRAADSGCSSSVRRSSATVDLTAAIINADQPHHPADINQRPNAVPIDRNRVGNAEVASQQRDHSDAIIHSCAMPAGPDHPAVSLSRPPPDRPTEAEGRVARAI